MKNEKDIPVLQSFRSEAEGLDYDWCPYCRGWHTHGCGDGYRVAHCGGPESPFHKTGYVLVNVGVLTPELERARKTPRKESRCPHCGSRRITVKLDARWVKTGWRCRTCGARGLNQKELYAAAV